MRIFRQLDDLPANLRGGAISIGNFDGVHRGHVGICQRLVAAAQRVGGAAAVFTFDPHPAAILRPQHVPAPLAWTERKAELLGQMGVDAMIAYPTNREMLQLAPEAFFQKIITEHFEARALVEGPNFCFGRDRAGDIRRLQELAALRGVEVEVVDPLQDGGEYVSSSRIRATLAAGDVATAAMLLTRPHRVRGEVVRGAGRGAGLGFATANLAQLAAVAPAAGVYAGRALLEGQMFAAAIHIGPIPTFGEEVPRVEVHLVGHAGELYGAQLEVDFIDRLRDIRSFDGVEQLKQQLHEDVAASVAIYRQQRSG